MKLCIKQEIFSFRDKFYVTDENGEDRYYIESEFFTFFKKFHIYNMAGDEEAYIEQNFSLLLPNLSVYIGGEKTAEITKEFTFFYPEYVVDGPGWRVSGDFFSHDYDITRGNETVASVNKEWFTFGDCYTVETRSPSDMLLALSVMLTVDFILSRNNNQ